MEGSQHAIENLCLRLDIETKPQLNFSESWAPLYPSVHTSALNFSQFDSAYISYSWG